VSNSVYAVNKGINKSIEFKGLKAQYIWYLGGGLIALLILFAIMYIIGLNTFICLGVILIAGTGLFLYVYRLSNTHGEFGMMKKLAKQRIPDVVSSRSRKIFIQWKKD
jgi:Flp pilus assembly protein TadB